MHGFSNVGDTSHTIHFPTHILEKSIVALFSVGIFENHTLLNFTLQSASSVLYCTRMEAQTKPALLPPIIPVNEETRAMLDYASSAEGRAKIASGRQEVRDGKGVTITAGYFDSLNRRISERVTRNRAA